jgi:hypothetical protein
MGGKTMTDNFQIVRQNAGNISFQAARWAEAYANGDPVADKFARDIDLTLRSTREHGGEKSYEAQRMKARKIARNHLNKHRAM